jgi:hypothetical protein
MLGVLVMISLATTLSITPILVQQQLANDAINQFGGTAAAGTIRGGQLQYLEAMSMLHGGAEERRDKYRTIFV